MIFIKGGECVCEMGMLSTSHGKYNINWVCPLQTKWFDSPLQEWLREKEINIGNDEIGKKNKIYSERDTLNECFG